jgi:hypothetical protein
MTGDRRPNRVVYEPGASCGEYLAFWLMEELLASAVVPSGVGCDTVLLVVGRGIVTFVLHPLLELHERGPLAGPYGLHTAWLLTVTVEVGVNVVAVLDLVVAVHTVPLPLFSTRER